MTPIAVTAKLRGAIADRSRAVFLDALLQAAVATRDGLPPLPSSHRGPTELEIPIAKSPCGRVYLASQGVSRDEEHELRWKNRRFPIEEAQLFGDAKLKRINIAGGPCRSYRIPLDTAHVADDEICWWAIGDRDAVEELLTGWVGYLGHRRAVGLGKVNEWRVEVCEPWGEGFPVVRDGLPTRPLPTDWPGVAGDAEQALRCLLPPYWRRSEEELCLVP